MDPVVAEPAADPVTTTAAPEPAVATTPSQDTTTTPILPESTRTSVRQFRGRLSDLVEQGEDFAQSVDRAANNRASFQVLGDAESVELTSGFGSFPPGTVPTGHYVVRARFAGGEPMVAGEYDLTRGMALVLRCTSSTQSCTRE